MTYFCIFCWFESSEPFDFCPRCHRQVSELDQASYTERLILSLQHPEAETRHRVAHILGMRRDIQAIPALAKITDETNDIFLLREIAWALGEMRVSDAIPTLRALLKNPSYLVRKEAVQALGKLGGEQALQALGKACEDPTQSVRELAIEVLKNIEKKNTHPD